MIQDIFPHRFENHYHQDQLPTGNDYILHFDNNTVLLKTEGDKQVVPTRKDISNLNNSGTEIYLFSIDETACFLIEDNFPFDASVFSYQPVNVFRTMKNSEHAWMILVGFHLSNWYAQNRFCGKCGSPTQHKSDERAMMCTSCGNLIFPRISPAVIVAITSGDKILLASNNGFVGGWYSLIAGYVDVGETLEETVRREIMEEVGIRVSNIRYYKSQPWGLSGSMMVGFTAEADDTQPLVVDNSELAEADWFTRGNLPNHALPISIAGEMIELFEKGEL